MPIFTPSRRWQKAYYPFKNRKLSERAEESLERNFKGILWGCRMCGNCLLQETAFICPMACPKGLRNGPCGGSTPDHCCVDESRPCIWYEIYNRADKMGRLDKLLEVLPPLDWDKTGTSALRDVYLKLDNYGIGKAMSTMAKANPEERKEKWDQFFMEIRQPDWWDGDSLAHPAPQHEPVSKLEEKLSTGNFVLTCELVPPSSSELDKFDEILNSLNGLVDAVNITDSPSSIPRVSPLVCAQHAIAIGLEPILQMAARDRTRTSLQTDLLGASASGIRNILLITGDHPNKGNKPYAKMDVWDFDSVQAAWIARKLRDESVFLDGRKVQTPPSYFIGGASSPYASKPEYQAIRIEKKMNAGVQFFQTNLIFDLEKFEAYLEALERRNLLSRMHLIAGITIIRSINAAQYLRNLPGIVIPDAIMTRIENAKYAKEEGYKICLETLEKLTAVSAIQGIHFMAINNFETMEHLIIDGDLSNVRRR